MNASDEEFVPEDEAQEGPALIKKLREKLKKAIEEKQEYLDGWQRSRADFANFKREEAGMHAEKEDRIKAELIENLLPALDSLELSLKHAPSKEMKIVEKQFLDALQKIGVQRFGTIGDAYDHHRYEILKESVTEDKNKNHTVEEIHRSGYNSADKIIRPAQVTINIYG